MQSYRTNPRKDLLPPVRADEMAIAQGRKGKPPIIYTERQLAAWARLRPLGLNEHKIARLYGCTSAAFIRKVKSDPLHWLIWERGPVETEIAVLRQELEVATLKRPDVIRQVPGPDGVIRPEVIKGGPHPGCTDMLKYVTKNAFGQSDRNDQPSPMATMDIRKFEIVIVEPTAQYPSDDDHRIQSNGQSRGNGPLIIEHEIVDPDDA